MIRETIREMAQERIAPRSREVDETCEFPWDWVELYRELGLFGIPFKPEYGGISGSALTLSVAVEELSKVDATAGLILAVQALGGYPSTSPPPRSRSRNGSPRWPAVRSSVPTA